MVASWLQYTSHWPRVYVLSLLAVHAYWKFYTVCVSVLKEQQDQNLSDRHMMYSRCISVLGSQPRDTLHRLKINHYYCLTYPFQFIICSQTHCLIINNIHKNKKTL